MQYLACLLISASLLLTDRCQAYDLDSIRTMSTVNYLKLARHAFSSSDSLSQKQLFTAVKGGLVYKRRDLIDEMPNDVKITTSGVDILRKALEFTDTKSPALSKIKSLRCPVRVIFDSILIDIITNPTALREEKKLALGSLDCQPVPEVAIFVARELAQTVQEQQDPLRTAIHLLIWNDLPFLFKNFDSMTTSGKVNILKEFESAINFPKGPLSLTNEDYERWRQIALSSLRSSDEELRYSAARAYIYLWPTFPTFQSAWDSKKADTASSVRSSIEEAERIEKDPSIKNLLNALLKLMDSH